jgi:hypothetical protein
MLSPGDRLGPYEVVSALGMLLGLKDEVRTVAFSPDGEPLPTVPGGYKLAPGHSPAA